MILALALSALVACSNATLTPTDTGVDSIVDSDTVDTDVDTGPIGPTHVVINELLASNANGLTDEHGDADDWVELYNPTADHTDLSGWTLSNGSGGSWDLPDGTVIPAHGWLILWCDNDHDGPLHASFKLAAEGDSVHLDDADGVAIDATAFLAQEADVSWARMPGDRGSTWGPADPPTPGAPNGS